jgi:hypothetical protein
MADVAEALTRKLGPLPVWAWGVGAGVGINVGRWALARKAKGDAPADEDAANVDITGDYAAGLGAGSTGVPAPLPNSGGWGGPTATPVEDTETTPQSNSAWLAEATRQLVRTDGVAFSVVDQALQKYLNGDALTAAEEGLVNRAFSYSGSPPDGAPPIRRATSTTGGAPPDAPSAPYSPVADMVAANPHYVTYVKGGKTYQSRRFATKPEAEAFAATQRDAGATDVRVSQS